jgi:hypothetical protein
MISTQVQNYRALSISECVFDIDRFIHWLWQPPFHGRFEFAAFSFLLIALEAIETVLALNPKQQPARALLANILHAMGNTVESQ